MAPLPNKACIWGCHPFTACELKPGLKTKLLCYDCLVRAGVCVVEYPCRAPGLVSPCCMTWSLLIRICAASAGLCSLPRAMHQKTAPRTPLCLKMDLQIAQRVPHPHQGGPEWDCWRPHPEGCHLTRSHCCQPEGCRLQVQRARPHTARYRALHVRLPVETCLSCSLL